MLAPQRNPDRTLIDLSGLWQFYWDPDQRGLVEDWPTALNVSHPSAVPGSWNDQFETGRDYLGVAWYATTFDVPAINVVTRLRFSSVNYLAEVWLNGVRLGEHEGGHLPFEFDVSAVLRVGNNQLVVRVDGSLAPDRVPPGQVPSGNLDAFNQPYPDANFDFFPYCGIQRPVLLYSLPAIHLADVKVHTDLDGTTGLIEVRAQTQGAATAVCVRVDDYALALTLTDDKWRGTLRIPEASVWEPGQPHLYDLRIEVLQDERICDTYTLLIGVRTIRVVGDQILLNGRPFSLRGVNRHEDFPIIGRGQNHVVAVKDLALMQWIGANSKLSTDIPVTVATWAIYGLASYYSHLNKRPALEKFANDALPLVAVNLEQFA